MFFLDHINYLHMQHLCVCFSWCGFHFLLYNYSLLITLTEDFFPPLKGPFGSQASCWSFFLIQFSELRTESFTAVQIVKSIEESFWGRVSHPMFRSKYSPHGAHSWEKVWEAHGCPCHCLHLTTWTDAWTSTGCLWRRTICFILIKETKGALWTAVHILWPCLPHRE